MNIFKGVVPVMWMCVAVLVITGCSESSSSQSAAEELRKVPAFTDHQPEGYDSWRAKGGGKTTAETQRLAAQFGLEDLYLPSENEYDLNVMGVALLNKYCVLTFYFEAEVGYVGIELSSRYNNSYILSIPRVRFEAVGGLIEGYRPACAGEEELDMNPDPLGVDSVAV